MKRWSLKGWKDVSQKNLKLTDILADIKTKLYERIADLYDVQTITATTSSQDCDGGVTFAKRLGPDGDIYRSSAQYSIATSPLAHSSSYLGILTGIPITFMCDIFGPCAY